MTDDQTRNPRSQVWLVGQLGAVIRPVLATQPLLIILAPGAPRTHISNTRLLGQLRVHGGELRLSDCIIEEFVSQGARDGSGGVHRRLESAAVERALSVVGGHVILTRTEMIGHSVGAITVRDAYLTLFDCNLRGNRAQTGGALLVAAGSNVTIDHSQLIGNSANVSGGALQVANTSDHMHMHTPRTKPIIL